jgi:LPS export ABC transporter protein LptC
MATLVFACGKGDSAADLDRMISDEQVEYEEAIDVNMIYSDSAIIRVNVSGPRLLRYVDRSNQKQEFPDGIKVVFYSPNGRSQSTLTAKYATRLDKNNEITIRDSVIWKSYDGKRLETEELIWNEREERVYSNRFVKIVKPDEVIYGYGFEANQEFTEWTINAVEGEFLRTMIDQ